LIQKWKVLETAKRRFLYDIHQLGFDQRYLDRGWRLVFEFKADTPDEHVITGHADGVITINLAEADPVQREQARQKFGEPHRTVIGHLRHEFGHYWWLREVKNCCEPEFFERFGDHNHPSYADAMPQYYEQGPPADWQQSYISEYASSHPWEDFAETAGFYQDMMAMLDTLRAVMPEQSVSVEAPLEEQMQAYFAAGISLNELSRTMGITDLVPEVVSPAVVSKLAWIHELRPAAAARQVSRQLSAASSYE
jgi:hypothetical protein